MAQAVFVDTSAWYALVDAGDNFHTPATAAYARLLKTQSMLVTTNLILAESHALILRWVNQTAALEFLARVRKSAQVDIVYATAELDAWAEVLLHQYNDHDFSLTDAVSFITMRARQITDAFTFDHHFRVAGFTLLPPAPI
jgi:predicted nucleic acid-binding protein